ncbi:MAG: hypothetical protein QOG60_1859 [Frankiaceae bacterium]|nr:hypothetical protein [Frankiaceae bacterium]
MRHYAYVTAGPVIFLGMLAVFLVTIGVGLLIKRWGTDRGTEVFVGRGEGAWIRIRRLEGGFQDRNRRHRVQVDGQDAAAINQNDQALIPASPGRHSVRVSLDTFRSNELCLELAPGQTLTLVVTDPADRHRAWFLGLGSRYLQLATEARQDNEGG